MITIKLYTVRIPAKRPLAEFTASMSTTAPKDPTMGIAWRAHADDGTFVAVCDAENEAKAVANALRLMAERYEAKARNEGVLA